MSNLDENSKKILFRTRLKELLVYEDLPHDELAQKIGISSATLSRSVSHGIIPQLKTLIKIANYFNISVEYLLGYSNEISFEPSTQNTNFYERLNELKVKNALSNSDLTEVTHIPRQYFYNWQKNQHLPTLELLENLANHFQVTLDYLLGRTD